MLQIETILSLYPDDATRLSLLSQALAHSQADLASLRYAVYTGDRDAALAHTHKAKGTASFLGADKQTLQQFDQLTLLLRNTNDPAIHVAMPAATHHAFQAVESILQDLEMSIQTMINGLENNKTRISGK